MFDMVKRLFKRPSFLIGLLFLVGLLLASLLYSWLFDSHIPVPGLLKDEKGEVLPAPYSPSDYFPFGTDNFGRNLFFVILVGAKYTIGLTIIITILRIIPSVLFGLFNYFYMGKALRFVKNILDAFNYFPVALLAFLLLNWVMLWGPMMNFEDDFSISIKDSLYIYIGVLVIIGIPPLILIMTNEIEKIMGYEFIESARVLGASKWHFTWKHIKPFLLPQLVVIFLREFISVLILIAHLGLLTIFIGGRTSREDLFGRGVYMSTTNEWAGLIGSWWNFLMTTYPWITIIPVVFITLTILAAKMMLSGVMKEVSKDSRI